MYIKFCGIKLKTDLKKALEVNANACGFIAYEKSSRFISHKNLKKLFSEFDNKVLRKVRRVGVFVNADINLIQSYIKSGINTVQLHGDESSEYAFELESKFSHLPDIEIWKAIRPQTHEDILEYPDYPCDKFLIDTFSEKRYGGSGKTADWELANFAVKTLLKPVILAGGLSPENITEAAGAVSPFGLDINSGVEISPGKKNHDKMDDIIQKIENLKI